MRRLILAAALTLTTLIGAASPAAAGEVLIRSRSSGGTVTGAYSTPDSSFGLERISFDNYGLGTSPILLSPEPGATTAEASLVEPQGFDGPTYDFVHHLEAVGEDPSGALSSTAFAASGNITSRTVTVSLQWQRNLILDETGAQVPDPDDNPPASVFLVLEVQLSGSAHAEVGYLTNSGGGTDTGSASAEGWIEFDGQRLTLATAATSDPNMPASPTTDPIVVERVVQVDFTSGEAEVVLAGSAFTKVVGTEASLASAVVTATLQSTTVRLVKPDPRIDPAVRGVNEYVFYNTPTGSKVQIPCQARFDPKGKVATLGRRFNFAATGLPGIEWLFRNANSTTGILEAIGEYGPLPKANSWFDGPFEIQLVGPQSYQVQRAKIQLFFQRAGNDHPEGKISVTHNEDRPDKRLVLVQNTNMPTLNFFYYWMQTAAGAGPGTVHYSPDLRTDAGTPGSVPSMLFWHVWTQHKIDPALEDLSGEIGKWRGTILVGPGAQLVDTRGVMKSDPNRPDVPDLPILKATGIDCFAKVLIHERRHVEQMAFAETVVPGWSWNVEFGDVRWNHGMMDSDRDDLPDGFDLWPNNRDLGVEYDARRMETINGGNDNDKYALLDWGSPGKRHGKEPDGPGNPFNN